jgi:hypothetical protein
MLADTREPESEPVVRRSRRVCQRDREGIVAKCQQATIRIPITLFGLLLLPASAKRLVKLNKTLELVAVVLGQSELGAEQRALIVEDLEIGGDTATVALERCANRIAEILDRVFLRYTDFIIFLISDQSIRDVPERPLNDLFVGDQKLSLLRLGKVKVPAESTRRENGLRQLRCAAPGSDIGVYEGREH